MVPSSRDDDERAARPPSPTLAAWTSADRARALHPIDEEAIEATSAARSLVLDLLATPHERDLFSACARLGALLAEAGASPSLASGTIDAASRAVPAGSIDGARLAAARASLVEGYVAAVRAAEAANALRAWEYPRCAVALGDGVVAIACGHPEGDEDALAAWAARTAARAAKAGVREALLAGPEGVTAEVASALDLAGVRARVAGDARAPRGGGTKRARFPWPWRR